jgi:hypothetical protein
VFPLLVRVDVHRFPSVLPTGPPSSMVLPCPGPSVPVVGADGCGSGPCCFSVVDFIDWGCCCLVSLSRASNIAGLSCGGVCRLRLRVI